MGGELIKNITETNGCNGRVKMELVSVGAELYERENGADGMRRGKK